jgi:protein-S-isoprenylcysteine O-methyltransferase Ste14
MDIQRKRLVGAKILGGLTLVLMLISKPQYNIFIDILGFILIVISGIGRVWSSAYISGLKSKKVISYGPYSIVRNPLYLFSFLGFVGAGLAFGSIIITLLLVITFAITHIPIILYEEKKLIGIFGDEFRDYMKRVPRFIPRLSKIDNPKEAIFRPKQFSKSVRDATLIILSYGIIKILIWLHNKDILPNIIELSI